MSGLWDVNGNSSLYFYEKNSIINDNVIRENSMKGDRK